MFGFRRSTVHIGLAPSIKFAFYFHFCRSRDQFVIRLPSSIFRSFWQEIISRQQQLVWEQIWNKTASTVNSCTAATCCPTCPCSTRRTGSVSASVWSGNTASFKTLKAVHISANHFKIFIVEFFFKFYEILELMPRVQVKQQLSLIPIHEAHLRFFLIQT